MSNDHARTHALITPLHRAIRCKICVAMQRSHVGAGAPCAVVSARRIGATEDIHRQRGHHRDQGSCRDGGGRRSTTNPSLLAKAGRKIETEIPEICDIVGGPVSAEVVATECCAILDEARSLAGLHQNVVVKVPMLLDGLRAVRILKKEGIRTNVTLCFTATQALLAAKASAAYISPFLGRVDDISWEVSTLVEQIVRIYRNYKFSTQVPRREHPKPPARSAGRDDRRRRRDAAAERDPPTHPLTDLGLEKFLRDAERNTAAKM